MNDSSIAFDAREEETPLAEVELTDVDATRESSWAAAMLGDAGASYIQQYRYKLLHVTAKLI